MYNPGIIYFAGTVIMLLVKNKYKKIITIMIPLLTILLVYNLPENSDLVIPYLNFEIVLYQYHPVSQIIAFIFSSFGLIAVIYSINFNTDKHFLLLNLYIGSSISILFSGDFFSFLIFWELMTVSSYFLIYSFNNKFLKKSSLYYLVFHIIGGLSLLLGVIIQYIYTGSISLTEVSYGIPFFGLAVGIKLAFIGLHYWLPKNYARVPFHISVILSAYTTKVGVYAFYKLMGEVKLEYIGVVLAITGVLLALKQVRLRKILSYHLMSQTGYMLTGIAIGTDAGISGGFFHVVNHILYKGLLFMAAGCVIFSTGEEDLTYLGGLYKKLPFAMIATLIGSLAISGFPLLNGYLSKLLIKKSVMDNSLIYYGLMIASTGTALSFMKLTYYTFFNEGEVTLINKPGKAMKIGMAVAILLIVLIGINPFIFQYLFSLNFKIYFFTFKNIISGLIPILFAIPLFVLISDIIKPSAHSEKDGLFFSFLKKPDVYLEKIIHNKNYKISSYIYNSIYLDLHFQLMWVFLLLIILLWWS
ncbi:MAG: proton-conducting transporter membrane subunit [Bacillota bacterium]